MELPYNKKVRLEVYRGRDKRVRARKVKEVQREVARVQQKRVLLTMMTNKALSDKKGTIKEALAETGVSSSVLYGNEEWHNLLEEFLPDVLIAAKHRELLEKRQVYISKNKKTGEIECIPTGEIDAKAVTSALDMSYKLKKRYDTTITVRGGISALSDDELEARITAGMAQAFASIQGESAERSQ